MKNPVAGPAKGHGRRPFLRRQGNCPDHEKSPPLKRTGSSGHTSPAGFLRYTFIRSSSTRAGVLPAQEALP